MDSNADSNAAVAVVVDDIRRGNCLDSNNNMVDGGNNTEMAMAMEKNASSAWDDDYYGAAS